MVTNPPIAHSAGTVSRDSSWLTFRWTFNLVRSCKCC